MLLFNLKNPNSKMFLDKWRLTKEVSFNWRLTYMKAYAFTDVGMVRKMNQDYIYFSLERVGCLPNLFIVADGMGGHKAGDIASRCTVNGLVEKISGAVGKDPVSVISTAIEQVNREIINKSMESEDFTGMGTTVVVSTIIDGSLKVANVGDSRLYLIDNDIIQVTRDHSLVEEMVSMGKLDREAARTHKRKNVITRAIGAEAQVEAEMFSVDLKPMDFVLMCSDGLSNMIEDSDIYKIVKNSANLQDAVLTLINTANHNGGKDNISVILIQNV